MQSHWREKFNRTRVNKGENMTDYEYINGKRLPKASSEIIETLEEVNEKYLIIRDFILDGLLDDEEIERARAVANHDIKSSNDSICKHGGEP